jgi:uncharacterized protein YraI
MHSGFPVAAFTAGSNAIGHLLASAARFALNMPKRIDMHYRWLLALATLLAAPSTHAAEQAATITQSVNVRAGPDRFFPAVTWLLSGTPVTVVGCVESWRWCDVIYGRERGWVYTRQLGVASGGSVVTVRDGGPALGVPAITFSLGEYWDAHYRGRPWAANQAYWQTRWERRPEQQPWRPPRSAG